MPNRVGHLVFWLVLIAQAVALCECRLEYMLSHCDIEEASLPVVRDPANCEQAEGCCVVASKLGAATLRAQAGCTIRSVADASPLPIGLTDFAVGRLPERPAARSIPPDERCSLPLLI